MRPALVGVPYDASSSFLRGAAGAPAAIRDALHSRAGNPWAERLVEVASPHVIEDIGDVEFANDADPRAAISSAVRTIAASRPFIALGGDHSITYPIIRGLHAAVGPMTILQIDAHPDLYDEFEGDRFSHACPFARIMEEGLASRLVQVGIRAMTGHGRDQARRFGVEQIDMRAWADGARPALTGRVYVSLDLDGIDPAFAPGVAHREPGGLSAREVLNLLDTLGGDLIGADIVEFVPAQDLGGLTAALAAKLVKELTAQFLIESD